MLGAIFLSQTSIVVEARCDNYPVLKYYMQEKAEMCAITVPGVARLACRRQLQKDVHK